MLQDNSRMMLEQTCSLNKNNESNINLFRDIESYDELVELAIDNGYDTSLHVEDILTREELEEIDRRKEEIDESFKKQTGLLNPIDLSFLALATALQCVRQYCLTPFHERQMIRQRQKLVEKIKKYLIESINYIVHLWKKLFRVPFHLMRIEEVMVH